MSAHGQPKCDVILVLKNGNVSNQGSYTQLKSEKVNFSTYVSDFSPIEDDPQGILEQINELKLAPSITAVSKTMLKNRVPIAKRTRSPLVTSNVISAEDDPEAQDTVRSILAENTATTRFETSRLDDAALSKLIEAGSRVLTGPQTVDSVSSTRAPPIHFSNQDPVSSRIEQNRLAVYTDFDIDEPPRLKRLDTTTREDEFYSNYGVHNTEFSSYTRLLAESTGQAISIMLVIAFFLVQGFRLGSGTWLIFGV